MTFCLGAQPLRAPPLIAHRLTKSSSVLALRLVCRKADACGIRLSYLMRPRLVIPHGSPHRPRVPPIRGLARHRNPVRGPHGAKLGVRHAAYAFSRAVEQPFTFTHTNPNQIERNSP